MSGFKEFLLRGNVVDMAVGIVVGAAFGTVVTAFVKDLLTPFIAAVVKAPDFSAMSFTLHNSKFMIGHFINELISFILIASAVYFVVVIPVNKLIAMTHERHPDQCQAVSSLHIGAELDRSARPVGSSHVKSSAIF